MHAGRLLALDTIPELKKIFAPGSVLEVDCSDAARALDQLDEVPEVIDAALFGDHLHAVVSDPAAAPAVQRHLETRGFAPVALRPLSPSLEDVFIRSIREAEEGREQ
jgi:ABC-2 type transport system ATP-binding protein